MRPWRRPPDEAAVTDPDQDGFVCSLDHPSSRPCFSLSVWAGRTVVLCGSGLKVLRRLGSFQFGLVCPRKSPAGSERFPESGLSEQQVTPDKDAQEFHEFSWASWHYVTQGAKRLQEWLRPKMATEHLGCGSEAGQLPLKSFLETLFSPRMT